ncbi:MAG: hypothetical protein AB8F95_21775 [Bacteroidia bacterium]
MALSVLMWALMVQAVPAVSASTEAVHATIAIQIAETVEFSILEEQTSLSPSFIRPLLSARPAAHREPHFSIEECASARIPRAGPLC